MTGVHAKAQQIYRDPPSPYLQSAVIKGVYYYAQLGVGKGWPLRELTDPSVFDWELQLF